MKQKIVFFTARDLSNVGGGERMLSLIANGLCDSFSITILTPYEVESFYPFDERITIENLGFKKKIKCLEEIAILSHIKEITVFPSSNRYLPFYCMLVYGYNFDINYWE